MRRYMLLVWTACLLLGAAIVRPLTERVLVLGELASSEAVHIVAHLFLYGTLTALARHAGLSARRAALLALSIGVLQESIQLLSASRGPGWPELFDLGVDGVAILAALLIERLGDRRAPASS